MRGLVSRRAFLGGGVVWLAGAAGMPAGVAGAAGDGVWLERMQRLTLGLKAGLVTPHEWRRRARRIMGAAALRDVRRLVERGVATAPPERDDDPEPQRHVVLPPGVEPWAFTAILAHIERGATVVPHGHRHMASLHVVLEGAVRVRQYDRVADEPDHLVIRPRVDRVCRPGDTSAIAPDRGNVHWFTGLADSYALIVATYGLGGTAVRDFVDPLAAERGPGRLLRAPRLTEPEAFGRYASA